MPRKLLLVLFSIYITCSSAQVRYQKCTVYSTKSSSGPDSFVTKVMLYNKYGKITEERTYTQPKRIIFYTYTKDTLLSLEKTICTGNTDQCLDDTSVAWYSYNKNNKIASIISARYGRGGTGCLVGIEGTRWYDSTKTEYHYDGKGNLTDVTTSDLAANMPTGFTIGFHSNFKAYDYDDKGRISSISHLHVESLEYFGREIINETGSIDTTMVAKEIFNYYDQCYTVDLITTDLGRIVHNISFVFYDSTNNIIQEYIHDSYLAEKYYDGPVERFYSYQPDKRLIKEILYDDLGRVERVDNYIYE